MSAKATNKNEVATKTATKTAKKTAAPKAPPLPAAKAPKVVPEKPAKAPKAPPLPKAPKAEKPAAPKAPKPPAEKKIVGMLAPEPVQKTRADFGTLEGDKEQNGIFYPRPNTKHREMWDLIAKCQKANKGQFPERWIVMEALHDANANREGSNKFSLQSMSLQYHFCRTFYGVLGDREKTYKKRKANAVEREPKAPKIPKPPKAPKLPKQAAEKPAKAVKAEKVAKPADKVAKPAKPAKAPPLPVAPPLPIAPPLPV